MLNIIGGLKIFLAVEPADMRKSFNVTNQIDTVRHSRIKPA